VIGTARFDACCRAVGIQHKGVIIGDALENRPCVTEATQRHLVAVRRIFGTELENESFFAAQFFGIELHGYDLRLDGVEPLVAEHDRTGTVFVGLNQLAVFNFPVTRSDCPFSGIILQVRGVNLLPVDRDTDVRVLGRCLIGSQTDATDRSGFIGQQTQLRVDGEVYVRTVVGEHTFDPIGTAADHVIVPHQNQIDSHAALGVLHQRSIGSHRNQIRVAFHAHDEGPFTQRTFHIARPYTHITGVFADIGFVPLFTRELVEIVGIGVEPAGEVVKMGIIHVITVDP